MTLGYYPFGLKHKGYNNVTTSNGNSIGQKKRTYQSQEFHDDLGLNWHEWKYRFSDPAIGRFISIDPLAEDYRYNGTYNFAENRVIDGFELEGLEYVSIHHFMKGDKQVTSVSTEYYKMSDRMINEINGTPEGPYNAASYGPKGKGVEHLFYDYNTGREIKNLYRWDNRRIDFASKIGNHGLYSGAGSITGYKGKKDYDFSYQPIDISDAIAKRHDEDYEIARKNAKGPSADYIEDVNTYQADVDMIARIDAFMNGEQVTGIETPYRTSYSTEMGVSLAGQKVVINALATYKKWKIDNGYGNEDTFNTIGKEFTKYNKLIAAIIGLISNNKNK